MRRGVLKRGLALLFGLSTAPTIAGAEGPIPSPALLDAVGQALVDDIGTVDAKILLYAEFDANTVGASVLYVRDGVDALSSTEGDDPALVEALFKILYEAQDRLGDRMWKDMIYLLDHGKVSIDLRYPNDLSAGVTTYEKVGTQAARHFPGFAY